MKLPFVISLPHCAARIPKVIREVFALSDGQIQESMDLGSAEVFGNLPVKQIVKAHWSRLVVDLNRAVEQRGPKGVIAQLDYQGRITHHRGKFPDEDQIAMRLKRYYWPFHHSLEKACGDSSIIGLFDCHSLNGIGPTEAPDPGGRRKDIVLGNNGDLNGKATTTQGDATCPAEALQRIQGIFTQFGFSVAVNYPYSGGFITLHYGRMLRKMGKLALQIEINQDLYVKEGPQTELSRMRLKEVRKRIYLAFAEIARCL
jgi:N-formylglutamate amidohydrolase